MTRETIEPGLTSIRTFTGGWFDVFDPCKSDMDIVDIAHALACMNRFAGHARFPYSVAQHSVLAARKAPTAIKLQALLHDAHEAYTLDMPRPIKRQLPDYRAMERAVELKLREKFGLPADLAPEVKVIDTRLMLTEARALGLSMPPHDMQALKPYRGLVIEEWNWRRAKGEFLESFTRLS